MRNTTTTVVTVAGAVLAAVIVTKTPAQQKYGPAIDGACCHLDGTCTFGQHDVCDASGGTYQGEGVTCQQVACFATPPPTVVSVSVSKDVIGSAGTIPHFRIFRAWSDGQVDSMLVEFDNATCNFGGSTCGPVVLITGTCPTDIDRNGDTGINDFLTLLGGWGECR